MIPNDKPLFEDINGAAGGSDTSWHSPTARPTCLRQKINGQTVEKVAAAIHESFNP